MSEHALPLLLGFLGAAVATPAFARWLSQRSIALARPRGRDVHTQPIPRLGGLVIAALFWLGILLTLTLDPNQLQFVDESIFGIDRNLLGMLLGTGIVVILGVVDDLRGVKPGWKLAWQVLAASCLPIFGVQIQWLAHPLGGPNLIVPPFIDSLLVVGWVVLTMNVMNLLDGLDGLATGVGSIGLMTLYFLALAPFVDQPALAFLLILLLGPTLGFLPWNWHPARIFLGDSGSQLIGYLIGVAAIISGGKLATAALVLSLPILDAVWTIIRRLMARRSPFEADREHLHHRLLRLGLPQPVIVMGLMAIAALFGIIALTSRTAGKVQTLLGAGILMLGILVALTILDYRMRRQK